MADLTQARLREVLNYDPETGEFTWRVNKSSRARIGQRTGSKDGRGYLHTTIDWKFYDLHRLAWFYVHGHWPAIHIDHINGKRTDNRLVNLREATRSQNQANMKRMSRNRSGYKGIIWERRRHRWSVRISKQGKCYYLGQFKSLAEARAVYEAAAIRLNGEFARFK